MRINDVDEWVYAVKDTLQRFYPTAASKATGYPIGPVFKQLLGLSRIGWLDLAYEVRCDTCGAIVSTKYTSDPTSLYEDEAECGLCGDEFEVTAHQVFPVFTVNEAWRQGSKKEIAVSGRTFSSTGGGATSLATVVSDGSVTWGDLLPTQQELQALRELAAEAPHIRSVLTELQEVPKNARERRSRLNKIKELGETFNVWLDAGKKFSIGVLVGRVPEAIEAARQFFSMM